MWVWKRYSRCEIQIVLAGNTIKGIYSLQFSKLLSWKDTPDGRQTQSMRGEESENPGWLSERKNSPLESGLGMQKSSCAHQRGNFRKIEVRSEYWAFWCGNTSSGTKQMYLVGFGVMTLVILRFSNRSSWINASFYGINKIIQWFE